MSIQCPVECDVDAACDSSPMAGDGVCTEHDCTAGNRSTTPYDSGSDFGILVMSGVAGDIVDSGLGPDCQ